MIELANIHARFGDFELSDIDLRVPRGKYCVLLGPPGSGKTSIVELIAGLRRHDAGHVILDGRRVDHLDPADRHVAYVPQDYALFTSKDVYRNIAFGLSVRHVGRPEIDRRVRQAAAVLGISHLLGREIRGLSGGERQRVALARAIVLESGILLLDEPVSALDESTRERVCLELRSLHDALGMTTIHVSHNFEETRAVADQVAVLNNGRIAQAGTVEEIFRRPESEFVARFVRAGNILHGQVDAAAGDCRLTLAGRQMHLTRPLRPGPVAMLLRQQDLRIHAPDESPPAGRVAMPGTVVGVRDLGGLQVTVRVAISKQDTVEVAVPRPDDTPPRQHAGDKVQVSFDPSRLHLLLPD